MDDHAANFLILPLPPAALVPGPGLSTFRLELGAGPTREAPAALLAIRIRRRPTPPWRGLVCRVEAGGVGGGLGISSDELCRSAACVRGAGLSDFACSICMISVCRASKAPPAPCTVDFALVAAPAD